MLSVEYSFHQFIRLGRLEIHISLSAQHRCHPPHFVFIVSLFLLCTCMGTRYNAQNLVNKARY